MNGYRLSCLAAIGAVSLALTNPAAALDGRHQVVSTVATVGAPIAPRTTAHVLYVVPVVPTLLGIRPAPVGQPVVYVIESPEDLPAHRQPASASVGLPETAAPEAAANGPRIITIE
jgi:hypothetical protein